MSQEKCADKDTQVNQQVDERKEQEAHPDYRTMPVARQEAYRTVSDCWTARQNLYDSRGW